MFVVAFFSIITLCYLRVMQLHGNGSRRTFPLLAKEEQVIHVLHSDKDGDLNNISQEECSLVDWIQVDSATGGRYVYFSTFAIFTLYKKGYEQQHYVYYTRAELQFLISFPHLSTEMNVFLHYRY